MLYQQSHEALEATLQAEQKISQEFTKWKADELLASQDQLAKILAQLDSSFQEAFKELNKPKGQSARPTQGNHWIDETAQLASLRSQIALASALMQAKQQLKGQKDQAHVQAVNGIYISAIKYLNHP